MSILMASRSTAAALTLVLGLALASCSSDSDSETAQPAEPAATAEATPSGPDLCASTDELRTSLTALKDVQVVDDGIAALAEAWAPVQDDVAAVEDAARAEFTDDVDAVRAEADAVRDAIDTAQATPSAESLRTSATAVRSFVDQADALVTEVTSTC